MKTIYLNMLFMALLAASCSTEGETPVVDTYELNKSEKDSSSLSSIESALEEIATKRNIFPPKFPDHINPATLDFEKDLVFNEERNDLLKLLNQPHSDWKLLHAQVRDKIASYSGKNYAFFLNQLAALHMSFIITKEEHDSDELASSLAYYTEILLQYEYDRPVPIARNLQKLRGFWSKDKIQKAAQNSIHHAQAFENKIKAAQDQLVERINSDVSYSKSLQDQGVDIERIKAQVNARKSNTQPPLWLALQQKGINDLSALAN